ncbi:MAG: phage tail tape measure protein [Pseudomonadota bacterium]
MASTIVDELVATLGYELQGEQNLRRFRDGLDRTEKAAKGSADRIKQIGKAAAVATTAATALGTKGFFEFAKWERQLTRIGITAEASAEQIADAGQTVQDLAFDFGLSIEQSLAGLDTLVASGLSLQKAMEFLPSVLSTAQAAGAATNDVANTALKTASALEITAEEMQQAFDIMVAGGKAGQFELRDMAQYIPELANSFASLGFEGLDGLQRLIALLQTVREDTGSASTAATQLSNIFTKVFAEETSKRFEDFGINLRDRLLEADAAGEDVLQTFVAISEEAINGDLTKLPLLFRDKEFQLGMQSLITSQESFSRFLAEVNGAEVNGAVFEDLNRVLGDSQTNIDRLSNSWNRLLTQVGEFAALIANPLLEGASVVLGGAQNIPDIAEAEQELSAHNAGLRDRIAGLNKANSAGQTVADARQDNRDQSVTNNVTINQTVTDATQAPATAAEATGRAVGRAASRRAQVETDPAF